jgi:hypothetical protein
MAEFGRAFGISFGKIFSFGSSTNKALVSPFLIASPSDYVLILLY